MKFYTLGIEEGRKKKYANAIEIKGFVYEPIHCNVCGRTWGRHHLDKELIIAMTNDNFPDFAGHMFYILVSERAKSILNQAQLSSFKFIDVRTLSREEISPEKLKDLRNEGENVKKIAISPPPYYLLRTHKAAKLHPDTQIGVMECKECGYHAPYTLGMDYVSCETLKIIDLKSWDGNDLFLVENFSELIFCTENFVDLYNKHELTGLRFQEVNAQ